MSVLSSLPVKIGVVVLAQALLVGAAVAPQLSARLVGKEYAVLVAPLDPIEPIRGPYVALGYPSLIGVGADVESIKDGQRGDPVYLPLEVGSDGYLVGAAPTRTRPEGLFLKCSDQNWLLKCGIESFFMPQAEALAMEGALSRGEVIATLRIDSRGNASVVSLQVED